MSSEVIADLMREHIVKLVQSGRRVDGRGLEETRKLTIEKNYIKTAEGSARVKLGNTDVLVGVKISTGEPYPDTPNSGVLTTSAELIPMASPTFESGPPRPEAIELARVVDRGIRETKTVDMEKLVITRGEKVWVLFIDIHALDYIYPKPMREAYDRFASAHRVVPHRAAMFDDLPHNLETAHALGMTTVLVHGVTDHPEHQAMAGWTELPAHIHHRTDALAPFLAAVAAALAAAETEPLPATPLRAQFCLT